MIQNDSDQTTLTVLMKRAEQERDPSFVWECIPDIAGLDERSIIRLRTKLKHEYGPKINLNDFNRLVRAERRKDDHGEPFDSALPAISLTDRPTRDVSEDAINALLQSDSGVNLFVRSGSLVRVRADEKGRAVIEQVREPQLRYALERSANFYTLNPSGTRRVIAPDVLLEDILAHERWPFQALEAIAEVPVMRPDGSILTDAGYDAGTRLFYSPPRGLKLRIPESPGADDARRAGAMLWDVFQEFPFEDDRSFPNLVALLLTTPLRPMITGPVPLALIMARQQGTGKGLLTELVCSISTGGVKAIGTAPTQKAEWRKNITSQLLSGATVIVYDNVDHKLDSPDLAAVLTAPEWTDRVLATSRQVRLPQRATWIATGNNIQLGGDVRRRSYHIMLNADTAQPWRRTGWEVSRLEGPCRQASRRTAVGAIHDGACVVSRRSAERRDAGNGEFRKMDGGDRRHSRVRRN